MKAVLALIALALAGCATMPPATAGPVAGLGQEAVLGGLRIRPIAIVEDSRCPVNVQCVWAGRLVILAEIDFHGGSEGFRGHLTLGQPLSWRAETVTLVAAEPQKQAGAQILGDAYRFTFQRAP